MIHIKFLFTENICTYFMVNSTEKDFKNWISSRKLKIKDYTFLEYPSFPKFQETFLFMYSNISSQSPYKSVFVLFTVSKRTSIKSSFSLFFTFLYCLSLQGAKNGLYSSTPSSVLTTPGVLCPILYTVLLKEAAKLEFREGQRLKELGMFRKS